MIFVRPHKLKTNSPRDQPGKRFYAITVSEDGLVDVYLFPAGSNPTPIARVVRGIEPQNDLETDIRARFDARCASGEAITIF